MNQITITIEGDRRSGKTTAAINMLLHARARGLKVAYFSANADSARWAKRMFPFDFIYSATHVESLVGLPAPEVVVLDDFYRMVLTPEGHPLEILKRRMQTRLHSQIIIVH